MKQSLAIFELVRAVYVGLIRFVTINDKEKQTELNQIHVYKTYFRSNILYVP